MNYSACGFMWTEIILCGWTRPINDERMRLMHRRRAEKFRDIPWYGSGIAERGEKAICNVSERGRRMDRRIIVEWYRRS